LFKCFDDLNSLLCAFVLCKRWWKSVNKEEMWEHIAKTLLIPRKMVTFLPETIIPNQRSWRWLCSSSNRINSNLDEEVQNQIDNFTGLLTLKISSAITYHGEILNGKKHGKGLTRFQEGRFEGDYQEDERTGKGSYFWDKGDYYTGEFLHGNCHGKGFYRFADGATFDGHFKEGKRTGEGIFRWSDGDYYQGNFENGYRSGRGIFVWETLSRRYEGEFVDGECTGAAVYYFQDGDRYEGKFRLRTAIEHGQYWFANGDMAELNITEKSAFFFKASDLEIPFCQGRLEPGYFVHKNPHEADHRKEYSMLYLDSGVSHRLHVKIEP